MEKNSNNYISLQEATKYCEYSQKYLSLRAKQGKLKAVKIGRNWVTKKEWVKEYIERMEEYNNNFRVKKVVPPPENLPIEEIARVRPMQLRPVLALALVFVLLIAGGVLGKTSFENVSGTIDNTFSIIAQKVLKPGQELAAISSPDVLKSTFNIFKEYGQWLKQTFKSGYLTLNYFIEEKLDNAARIVLNGLKSFTQGIRKIPQIVTGLFKKEIVIEKPEEEFVKIGELEKLQKELQALKEEGLPVKEIIKVIEVSRITKIEPIKEITKEIKTLDDESLKRIQIILSQQETEVGKLKLTASLGYINLPPSVGPSGAVSLTTLGTISAGTWQAGSIEDAYVADDLTIASTKAGSFSFSGTSPALTVDGQLLATKAPTLAHTGTWVIGSSTWNQANATIYINPASAATDSNLIGVAVAGQVIFSLDAEGDIFGRNLVLTGSTTIGTTTVGDLSVEGSTTLGDSTSDTLTFNPATLTWAGGNKTIDITGAATRTLSILNSTDGQVANLDLSDGSLFTANTSRLTNTGALENITGYSQSSGNFAISGSGTFSTATGAISLNGDVTIAANKNLTLSSGTGVISQTFSGTTQTPHTLTATFAPTAGGTQNALNLAITNNPSTSANTLRGLNLSFTDAGNLANTIVGLNVDVTTANVNDTTYAAIFQGGNVGIGTTSPNYKLDVSGDINFTGALHEDGVEILSGMISAFTGSCPTGWTEYTAAQGRTIVGTPSGGTGEGTQGTALANLGTRTITDVPSHLHSVDPPSTSTNTTGAHTHGARISKVAAGGSFADAFKHDASYISGFIGSAGSHSHTVDIAAFNSVSTGVASVDVTMPYIQLTYCKKNAGADLAEWIPTSEDISAETIVSIDPNNREKIIASRKPYDPAIIGIISAQPGWLIGEENPDSVQMALSGRVPTRVSLMNGEIQPGDPITASSILGVGMKATKSGPIVGKAMEALNETSSLINCSNPETGREEKCGTILVFVNISWFNPEDSQYQQDTILAQASNDYYELLRFGQDLDEGDLVSLTYEQAPSEKDPSQQETVTYIYKTSEHSLTSFVGVISKEINGQGDLLRRERVNNKIISEIRLISFGIAKVKISPLSEEIKPGDFLTSSDELGKAEKATKTGPTIARALESWIPDSGKETIRALIGFGWWDPDVYLTDNGDLNVMNLDQDTELGIEDQESGILNDFVQKVKQALASLGLFIENGIARIKTLIVENLQIGTPEKPTGITIYDRATGQPYCVYVENGETKTSPSECQNTQNPPPAEEQTEVQPEQPSTESTEPPAEPSVSEPIEEPVIEEPAPAPAPAPEPQPEPEPSAETLSVQETAEETNQ